MFRKTTKISAVYENRCHADVKNSLGVFSAAIEAVLFAGTAVTDGPLAAWVVLFTGDAVTESHVVIATVIVTIIMTSVLTSSLR